MEKNVERELPESAKGIYNLWLKSLADANSRQYRNRKDWTDLDDTKTTCLLKLDYLFKRFPQIDPYQFFCAPYSVYEDEKYFDLKFYTTQKALSVYSSHWKLIEIDGDIESEYMVGLVKNSFKFILKFCNDNKIDGERYLDYRVGIYPSFITHLKERHISIYALMEFSNLMDALSISDKSDRKVFGMEFYLDNYHIYRSKYNRSKVLKEVVRKGTTLIKKFSPTS